MNDRPVHLHSIVVHAVIGLAPLAAAAFILGDGRVTVGPIGPEVWFLLVRWSLVAMLMIAVPSTFTGIAERNHMYATWHRSHRAKLWLSMALIALTGYECVAVWSVSEPLAVMSAAGAAVIVGNLVVAFLLSFFGLRITLGRQGLGRTSYVPDMDRSPPVDVLEVVAAWKTEDPKMIDVLEEQR